jgi:hypothetical protein
MQSRADAYRDYDNEIMYASGHGRTWTEGTYHSRFIPERVEEVFWNTHVLLKLAVKNTADVTGGKPIAVSLQSISVSAINPLVAFCNIHERKREILFFYFAPDTTRDTDRRYDVITLP